MSVTTRGNINLSGQALQTRLNRKVLENFEPNLRFYDMGEKPTWKQGYNTLSWTRVNKLTVTAAGALLAEGITPTEQQINMSTVTLQANQYGLYVVISDLLEDVSAIPVVERAAVELGHNMARIVDAEIQSTLSSTGTNVIFANGSAGPRSALTSSDVLKARDLAKAHTFLSTKAAPQIGSGYVAVLHPNVAFDLQQESGTGTFIDLNKYTDNNAGKALKGELGMLFGVRIVTSAFIQTFASTVTVYPTYVMGMGAYGVADLQSMRSYITDRKATDSDPLAQRVKVGSKCAFNSIVLQQDALVRIESASSQSYVW